MLSWSWLAATKSPSKHNTVFEVAAVVVPVVAEHVEVKRVVTTVRATTPGVVGIVRQEATITATIASIKSIIVIFNTICKFRIYITTSLISIPTKAITF